MDPFYDGWGLSNERLVETIGALSVEALGLRAGSDLWPIWAITAHLAGARVYWLCAILKEPGAESMPFSKPTGEGWEDDLTHPRQAGELIFALESSWKIVEACLERWTPAMLQDEFRREIAGQAPAPYPPVLCSCGCSPTTATTVARSRRHSECTHSRRSTSGPAAIGPLQPERGSSRTATCSAAWPSTCPSARW